MADPPGAKALYFDERWITFVVNAIPLQTRAAITGIPEKPVLKVITLTEFLRSRWNPRDCALWIDSSAQLQRSRAIEDVAWGALWLPDESTSLTFRPSVGCVVSSVRVSNAVRPGDVVTVDARRNLISVLYRRDSRSNSFLVTERCNSYCVMCSQPPLERDDPYRVRQITDAIQLIDRDAPVIGITGGEPTLLGDDLLLILAAFREHLPNTQVHVLTNGRRFNDDTLTRAMANAAGTSAVWAVPLYSDAPEIHDYVVQRVGAFDETMAGLLNLGRYGQRIELRVVLQKAVLPRLEALAHFVSRNLTFVEHVAWMGLEPMGFARPNWKEIWTEPREYVRSLQSCLQTLSRAGIRTSVFNVPLCLLPREMHEFAVASISDWKNTYLPECDQCAIRSQCGGFFSSASREFLPEGIAPVLAPARTPP